MSDMPIGYLLTLELYIELCQEWESRMRQVCDVVSLNVPKKQDEDDE